MAKKSNDQNSIISTLTAKQAVFFYEYIRNGFNATAAATVAKYANPNTAGPRLLQNPKIIRALEFEVIAPAAMGAEEVLERLSEQARGEYANYYFVGEETVVVGEVAFTRKAVMLDVDKMIADGKAHLIRGVKNTPHGQNIETFDTHAALVDLGRYHKLFTDNLDANLATNDSGMTVEEWRDESAKRRKEAEATMAEFNDSDFEDTADDTAVTDG